MRRYCLPCGAGRDHRHCQEVFVSTGSQRMAYTVALTIHIPFMLLESFALLWKASFLRAAH